MLCQGQIVYVESVVSGATLKINVQNQTRLNVCSAQENTLRKIIFVMWLIAKFEKASYVGTHQKRVSTAKDRILLEVDAVRKKKAAIFEAKRLRSEQLQDDSQLSREPIEIDIDNEEDIPMPLNRPRSPLSSIDDDGYKINRPTKSVMEVQLLGEPTEIDIDNKDTPMLLNRPSSPLSAIDDDDYEINRSTRAVMGVQKTQC
jgi:hypothetical protein